MVAIAALMPSAPIAFAQGRAARIAFLSAGSAAGFATQLAGLRTGLQELGYTEGKNLRIDYRWGEGRVDRLPELANELVRLNVDVIVTQGVPATRAAKAATTSIPIVMAAVGDAVMMGIVSSFAKPGGNITGLTFFAPELGPSDLNCSKRPCRSWSLPVISSILAMPSSA